RASGTWYPLTCYVVHHITGLVWRRQLCGQEAFRLEKPEVSASCPPHNHFGVESNPSPISLSLEVRPCSSNCLSALTPWRGNGTDHWPRNVAATSRTVPNSRWFTGRCEVLASTRSLSPKLCDSPSGPTTSSPQPRSRPRPADGRTVSPSHR